VSAKGFEGKHRVLGKTPLLSVNPGTCALSGGASGLAQINLMIPQLAWAAEAEDKSYSKLKLWF